MAVKLEHFPAAGSSRYPWDEWLNGDVWQLFKGDDYAARDETLLSNARNQARRRDGKVRTRKLNDDGKQSVVVQFVRDR